MIKRLIFDVDNTLIEWKNEYWDALEDVCTVLNMKYSKDFKNGIIKAIDSYEETNSYYSKEKMTEQINRVSGYTIDSNFLNVMLKRFEKCVPKEDKNIQNILDILSKKYELVILTNWFTEIQEGRLKSFGILKYFTKVFGTENIKVKPNKESFIAAIEDRLPEECIMIGDSLENDIKGAINAGLKAIYLKSNANKNESNEYITINNISELLTIL